MSVVASGLGATVQEGRRRYGQLYFLRCPADLDLHLSRPVSMAIRRRGGGKGIAYTNPDSLADLNTLLPR